MIVMALAMLAVPALVLSLAAMLVAMVVVMTVMRSLAALFLAFTVLRRVDIAIPAVLDEVGRATAGVVAGAVLGPVPGMTGRDMQVERTARVLTQVAHGQRRGAEHQLRARIAVAKLDLAIVSGLPEGDVDGDIHGQRGCADGGCGNKNSFQPVFHDLTPVIHESSNAALVCADDSLRHEGFTASVSSD